MIGTSKQLKDLIGNRAHGDSAKSMLFLRNYAMERFLERLSASKYRNCFILKGGMLISAIWIFLCILRHSFQAFVFAFIHSINLSFGTMMRGPIRSDGKLSLRTSSYAPARDMPMTDATSGTDSISGRSL